MIMRRLRAVSGGMLLFAALGVGAVTAVLTVSWLQSQEASEDAAVVTDSGALEMRSVVVARSDLPAGTALTAPMLRVVEVPTGSVAPGVMGETTAVTGRTLRYPLFAGEQLLASKLVGADQGGGSGLAFSIPPGMRAVSVPFTEVMGAGGLVVPGDRVDVLVATTYERLFEPGQLIDDDSEEAGHPTVLTALQNALVLAVGQQFTGASDGGKDPATVRADGAEAQPGARSVTLAVTPEEAQSLFMAAQQGELGLALRAFGDDSPNVLAPQFKLEADAGSATGLAAAQ